MPFLIFTRESDTRETIFPDRLTLARLFRTFLFDPRRYPDFAWNWLGTFAFHVGLSMNTTFATYFYAQRLGIELRDVAGIIAITGSLSLLTTTVGSIGAGFLSDRVGRRRPFAAAATAIFATGSLVAALSVDLPSLLVGTSLMTLGTAVFTAVNQATVLDILPERDTAAGRFMAIVGFSRKIPSTLAPLVAPLVIALGASSDTKNYTLLYLLSGVCGLTGGLIIFFRVKGVR